MDALKNTAAEVRGAIEAATRNLVDRQSLAELLLLAAVAGEHVLIIGPPGTAKSAAVRRVAQSLGGNYFEYLLGRFTEPTEIFGPIDLRKLRDGVVETETSGMLPEADVAFLDEVFLGSTAILNTLLGVLNERQFKRGHTHIQCPLRLCVAASNEVPDEPSLAAFADRFLVHAYVEPVADHELENLLFAGWQLNAEPAGEQASLAQLDSLIAAAHTVDMSAVVTPLAEAIRTLRKADIHLSDRRIVKAQKMIAAASVLSGHDKATESDLWPLIAVIPGQAQQATARDVLQDLLARSSNAQLSAAVNEAAMSAEGRADNLSQRAQQLLAAEPVLEDEVPTWRLRVEALLRDVDVNFSDGEWPGLLGPLRKQLVGRLGEAGSTS